MIIIRRRAFRLPAVARRQTLELTDPMRCSRDDARTRRPHFFHRRAGLRDLGFRRTASLRCMRGSSRPVAISDCGTSARARNSPRVEKSFDNWARESRPIYTPTEAGLERFVDVAKPAPSVTSPCGTTARS